MVRKLSLSQTRGDMIWSPLQDQLERYQDELDARIAKKEILSRVRQLRFFKAIRNFQTGGNSRSSDAVLSCCGHTGPLELMCKKAEAGSNCCVEDSCKVYADVKLVVP